MNLSHTKRQCQMCKNMLVDDKEECSKSSETNVKEPTISSAKDKIKSKGCEDIPQKSIPNVSESRNFLSSKDLSKGNTINERNEKSISRHNSKSFIPVRCDTENNKSQLSAILSNSQRTFIKNKCKRSESISSVTVKNHNDVHVKAIRSNREIHCGYKRSHTENENPIITEKVSKINLIQSIDSFVLPVLSVSNNSTESETQLRTTITNSHKVISNKCRDKERLADSNLCEKTLSNREIFELINNSQQCIAVNKVKQDQSEKADQIRNSSVTQSPKDSSSLMPKEIASTSSMVCRICQTNSTQEPLISPCHCKGSMAYVHLSCLERWLNQSSRCYCELCMYTFNAIQTQRYGFIEGIKLWVRHPRNRSHLQSDLLIATLLTIVTIGLVIVCVLGMQYFIIEAKKLGLSPNWTKGVIGVFLCIIMLGYAVTTYLLVRDQVVPWFKWWRHTVDVRLLLTPSICRGTARQYNRNDTNV